MLQAAACELWLQGYGLELSEFLCCSLCWVHNTPSSTHCSCGLSLADTPPASARCRHSVISACYWPAGKQSAIKAEAGSAKINDALLIATSQEESLTKQH